MGGMGDFVGFDFIKRLASSLDGVLFPRRCGACRAPLMDDGGAFGLCGACMGLFAQKPGHSCAVCAAAIDGEVADAGITTCGRCRIKPPPFDGAFYGMRYEGPARELIHRFKFKGAFRLAKTVSAPLCAELFSRPAARDVDLVAPTPLHWRRNYERGYNQSYLVALEVGKALSKPVEAGALLRVRHTMPQFQLSSAERDKNIKGAFAAPRPEKLAGKTILLVDDIMTTGSTVAEAARALRRAGAAKVLVAAAARA
jgi:ComF family protein